MDASTPREKPFFIKDTCEVCENKLTQTEPDWYDEWSCSRCNLIFEDLPSDVKEQIDQVIAELHQMGIKPEEIEDMFFAESIDQLPIFGVSTKRGDC